MSTQQTGARLTAAEIFSVAVHTGEDELKRSSAGLALSGFAAGLGMGLTGLGAAAVMAAVHMGGGPTHLLATLLYPLGFIVVVLGRAQLFTENTLFPVVLVLDRRRHLRNTLRLWATVFAANIVGALLFAALTIKTSALTPDVRAALASLGRQTVDGGFGHIFWSGVLGGWIIALMAWLVSAARFTLGQIALTYALTFVVGAAHLAHCIAGSGEALSGVLAGSVGAAQYVSWLAAATLGNTAGGVLMVSLLNYGQVAGSGRNSGDGRGLAEIEDDGDSRSSDTRRHRKTGDDRQ